MTDFLLELRSEEIPARMQAKAREDLAKLFAAELAKSGLTPGETQTYATPRRLALIARGLPDATDAVSDELKGPKLSAPPQALEGFLRKTGLTREQLTERDGLLYAVTQKPGRATADVLAEAIPAIIRAFPWPKSMRWGEASTSTESLRWVRPLQGIVALFGEDVVPCEIAGITSGAATLGHRFHHPGPITIGSASDYVEKLRACHVIVDQDERRSIIALGATMAAGKAGLTLVHDEGLLIENAGLTEWPVPLLGRFDEAFLDVPPEVIQLTARVNQKYFVCHDGDGKLANAFVCTANIDANDGGATIVEGNRKVLAARLSDARFFYETDVKVPLKEQAKKLDRIVFHEKLGTVADKVDRVAKLARWLVEEEIVGSNPEPATNQRHPRESGDPSLAGASQTAAAASGDGGSWAPAFAGVTNDELAQLAERAARLCKADLVTGMVGEFPELQGVIGGYYAAAQGEHPAVAAAIRDHYKPVGQGDEVPADPVTVAVSLADKLDSLVSLWAAGERPTGSRDPFGLRRSALGVISVLLENAIRLPMLSAIIADYFEIQEQFDRRQVLTTWATTASVKDQVSDETRQKMFDEALNLYAHRRDRMKQTELLTFVRDSVAYPIQDFFADRLKVQQREAGVRHDLIDAVFALGGEDDLVRLLARVHALQSFIGTEDGANLLAGYKRAANILKKEGYETPRAPAKAGALADEALQTPTLRPSPEHKLLSYTLEKDEAALIAALDAAEPAAARAVAAEDFAAAMAALATLRAPIDAFFETVTVNDADADKRAARLALLARVRAAVHNVADFSRIES